MCRTEKPGFRLFTIFVDGLRGFQKAISAVYPKAGVQRCIIHQIRHSTRFVSYKDIKALMADLKKVYTTITDITEDEALNNLINFKEKWSKAYSSCVKSWEELPRLNALR